MPNLQTCSQLRADIFFKCGFLAVVEINIFLLPYPDDPCSEYLPTFLLDVLPFFTI